MEEMKIGMGSLCGAVSLVVDSVGGRIPDKVKIRVGSLYGALFLVVADVS